MSMSGTLSYQAARAFLVYLTTSIFVVLDLCSVRNIMFYDFKLCENFNVVVVVKMFFGIKVLHELVFQAHSANLIEVRRGNFQPVINAVPLTSRIGNIWLPKSPIVNNSFTILTKMLVLLETSIYC